MSALLSLARLQNVLPRHHHAEVDDLEAVALQDHADDVLADVVNVALDGRHDDPALALGRAGPFLLGLDERDQVGDRALHHARRLHHLRQEHLARPEQVADDVHAVHQRAFDDLDRARCELLARFLGIVDDVRVDALDQRVGQALADRQRAPFGELLFLGLVGAPESLGELDQPLGRIVAAIEDDILARFAQLGVDRVVDVELAGVDDAHVHARGDRVIEEHAVHRAAHRLVAAEREAEVGQAAGNVRAGAAAADLARRLDEVERVAAMLVDPGRDREDVGVEDDVVGIGAVGDEQLVGALADFDLAFGGVGLADLVERHDHDRGAISAALARELEERPLAFLHADRIDDRLARHAFEPGLDHAPFGAVDHHRHAGDVGLGGDALEEGRHRLLAVEQGLVHVDVDDLRAVLDLVAGDLDRGVIIAGEDQLLEARRAGDVAALADIDEARASAGLFTW